MRLKINNKGVVLISVYVVMLMIATLSVILYLRMNQEFQLTQRDVLSTQALYDAEKGISHAYFELISSGYTWRTHQWAGGALQPIASPTKINTLCQFDANGYYVPINSSVGNFKVKAFSDPDKPSIVIIRSLGSSGQMQRLLEYRASKRGIYDFFFYTPYDLNLRSLASGSWPYIVNADGGGIHANGNIEFYGQGILYYHMLVVDCYELSTPKNISYGAGTQYVRPAYIDDLDGSRDGMAPMPTLHRRSGLPDQVPYSWGVEHLWANVTGGPWGENVVFWGTTSWQWKTNGYFAGIGWPPQPLTDTDAHFPGNSDDVNKIWVNSTTGATSGAGLDVQLNDFNLWIKPYKLDKTTGEELSTKYTEIPAELDQPWSWDKYSDSAPGGEKTLTLYTRGLEEDGKETENIVLGSADDHWKLKKIGGAWNVYHSNNPGDPSYSNILKDPNYWNIIPANFTGPGPWADHINPDLSDSRYGDDLENIDVKILNSLEQKDAWKDFLKTANTGLSGGLTDIVMDGNTGGEYLEPPSFSKSYWRKAKNFGLYIGVPDEPDTSPTAGITDPAVIEKGIDAAVIRLNDNPEGITVARKVFAVSAYSGKKDCFLDIDLGKMSEAKVEPTNGIIYSRLPLRLSNAAVLPQKAGGFTVICEKGITLKGDYNYDRTAANPREKWLKAALVTRTGVTTVSNSYTDPQFLPAVQHYLNYPYMNVADQGAGNYDEVKIGTAGSLWTQRELLAVDNWNWGFKDGSWQYLPPDGIPDYYNGITSFPNISMTNQQTLKAKIETKDTNYRNTFIALGNDGNSSADYIDPVGNDTVKSWGRMVQPADKDYYYNALISTYYSPAQPGVDERWSPWNRTLKGSFIQLDSKDMKDDGFTAPASEIPSYDGRGSTAGWVLNYLGTYNPAVNRGYDREFHTASRSAADIFFGSVEPVWQELSVTDF